MPLVDQTHREATAMRDLIASALHTADAAHEHAGRIAAQANALGLRTVGARLVRAQQAMAQIRSTMATAGNHFTNVRILTSNAAAQPSPQELIDVLSPARTALDQALSCVAAAMAQVDQVRLEVVAALRGARPAPMLARVETVRTALADLAGRCETATDNIAMVLARALQTGDVGGTGGELRAPVVDHTVQPPVIPASPMPPTSPPSPATSQPPPWVEDLGRELPVRRRRTDPTTGSFNGETITSREDLSLVADLKPFRLGGWPTSLVSHVESHVAAMMRRDNLEEGQLVVNNRVCGNRGFDNDYPATCEKYLRSVLPASARLTVWATQDGGQTWWNRTYVGTGERILPPAEGTNQ